MSRLNSIAALAGFIVNNGIVMIDKIEINWREGQAPNDAVVSSAVSRFRPILLSVSTTMLGFLPLIINRDPLFLLETLNSKCTLRGLCSLRLGVLRDT